MFPPLKEHVSAYIILPARDNVTGGANGIRFSSFYRTEFLFHLTIDENFLKNLKEESVVYQKVDTNLNFVDREKQVEKFWKENHILKSMEEPERGSYLYVL